MRMLFLKAQGWTIAASTSFFLILAPGIHAAELLTFENAFKAYVKLSPDFDYDYASDSMFECLRPTLWSTYRDNELKYQTAKDKFIQDFKVAVSMADLTLIIVTTSEFGSYDPNAQAFSFTPLNPSTYFAVQTTCGSSSGIPRNIKIYITNYQEIDGLPMASNAAEVFLRQRNLGGFPNRNVGLSLTLTLNKISGDDALSGILKSYQIKDINKNNNVVLKSATVN